MRRLVIIGVAIAVAAVAYWALRPAAAPSGDATPGGRRAGDGRPVPVVPAPAVRKDVPIWLDGLGTVISGWCIDPLVVQRALEAARLGG